MMLKQLREIAERATPGGWYVDGPEVRVDLEPSTTNQGIADCTVLICDLPWINEKLDHRQQDRQFIAAANPATVLALLDSIGEMEGALRTVVGFEPFDGLEPRKASQALEAHRRRFE